MINSSRFLSTGRILAIISAPAVPVQKKLSEVRNAATNQLFSWLNGLRRNMGWKTTGLVLEVGLIVGGAIATGMSGWLALARYSSFLMVIGALIMLVGLAKGYSNMMLVTPREVFFNKSEKHYLSVPAANNVMAARYAAFMQMIFWVVCGILPILAGAMIQSFF